MQEHNIKTNTSFNAVFCNSSVLTVKRFERNWEGIERTTLNNYFFADPGLAHFNISDSCSTHCFAARCMNHVSDAAARFSHPVADPLEAVALFLCLNHKPEPVYVSN